MARSRQQRRARRAAQGLEPAVAAGAAAPPASPPRRPTARAGGEPERGREARVDIPRGGFVRESVAELKKVEWPSRQQVITGTIVVIIAVAIVGFYLWVADQAFKNLVEKVLI
jgi:preprotein translocase subunit SecE